MPPSHTKLPSVSPRIDEGFDRLLLTKTKMEIFKSPGNLALIENSVFEGVF